jgi:hypothetical protein
MRVGVLGPWSVFPALAAIASCGGGAATGVDGGTGQAGATGAGSSGGNSGSGGAAASTGLAGDGGLDAGTPIEPGDPGTVGVTFDIAIDSDVHAISPLIYGWNGWNGDAASNGSGQTLVRAGGNRWTAYNWENNASNAGSDYMFENDAYLTTSTTPGAALTSTLGPAHTNGAAALITIPIVDYVSADTSPGGDVRNSGASYLTTRFKQNLPTKGSAFSTAPSTSDAFVYQDEFVNWVKTNHGGDRIVFSLDNEPDLWSETHAEVHPNPVTYAELVTRNTTYAAAVKSVWPAAEVAGFVSYGWAGYETLQGASDAQANGEFLTYYLDRVKAAETTAGKRLVDYLDLHWYPETYVTENGNSVRITDNNDDSAAMVAARIAAPRSLWDPTYNENNWIAQAIGGPIDLIPTLKQKIAAHYPGTKLSFSEYDYGGGTDISGAIAQADLLGIFGREGVDMASAWEFDDGTGSNVYQLAALRIFRNFDGAGAAFGDTSIHAGSSDVAGSSVYAAVDAANTGRLTIVAINKSSTATVAGIRIAHPVSFKTAKVYTLTSASSAITAGTAIATVATNAFRYTMPAMSISLLIPQP